MSVASIDRPPSDGTPLERHRALLDTHLARLRRDGIRHRIGALRVADAIEAGMVWVNSENVRHLAISFGGMKASGIGRDGGDYSFDFYMETKHVSLAKGTHRTPKLGA